MAVVLKATWTATEGSEAIVLDALEKLAPRSREEPGCRVYQAYRDPAEPRVFHIFEIYDDEAAVEAHRAAPHFKVWREAAAKYVVPGSQVNTLSRRLFHHS